MHPTVIKIIVAVLFITVSLVSSFGAELQTRYTTVIYEDNKQLKQFNKTLYMGRRGRLLKDGKPLTLTDEVKNKIDLIVEKNEIALEMFPDNLKFRLVLKSTTAEVQDTYKNLYGKRVKFIAFYSPIEDSVFITVRESTLRVLAHEFAHAVINHYFDIAPSRKIHELLARFAENRIMD